MFEEDDPDFDRDDDVLAAYLEEEKLALVPIDFLHELMLLMEQYIMNQTGVTSEELGPIVDRLEALLGEEGMMDLSLEAIIGWVKTIKES